ncbi:MAG: hypothetical protein WA817_24585 [Candidatus Acidiferrum sp.]
MNRFAIFLWGSLMLLLGCGAAHGQGCFQANFGVYTSVARDGNNINTAVTITGYTTIHCNMASATHKVAAQNVISGTGGWTYSGSSCPSCYFGVTGYDTFVGVPGVLYLWDWDGEAICSIVGPFFSNGNNGSIPGCLVPSTEETDDIGWNGGIDREQFDMTLSDTAADGFDNHYVQEYTVTPGTNACWWSTSGLVQNPGTQNASWTVGTVGGNAEHNHWGYDEIGWNVSDLDNIIRNGPGHGVVFPCTITIYQGMQIECDANTWWDYRTDVITITVNNNPENTETNCRDEAADPDNCGLPVNFTYRRGKQSTWWARILKVPPGSPPQSALAKGAR